MNTQKMTERQILAKISQLQGIQMTNPPSSKVWNEASKVLQPLFGEMAHRTAHNRQLEIANRIGRELA